MGLSMVAAGVAAAAALTAGTVAGTSYAATSAAGNDVGPRIQRLCDRVPTAIQRTQRAEARLAGGVTVRGSLAWLQARIDAANAKNRPDLATLLSDRLKVRQDLVTLLPDRLKMLQDAQTACTNWKDHRTSTGTPSPSATS